MHKLIKVSLLIFVMFCSFLVPTLAEETEMDVLIEETNLSASYLIHDEKPSRNPRVWAGYSFSNIKGTRTEVLSNVPVKSATLTAGGSNTYTITTSRNTTVSGVLSIGPKDINGALGISQTDSVSISDSYSFSCPKSKGGKTVVSCTVTYYPLLQHYSFDEYFLGSKSGSGTSVVLTGFHQIATYTIR